MLVYDQRKKNELCGIASSNVFNYQKGAYNILKFSTLFFLIALTTYVLILVIYDGMGLIHTIANEGSVKGERHFNLQ